MLGACPKTKYSNDRLVMKIIFSNKSIPNRAMNGMKIRFPGFLPKSSQKIDETSSSSFFSFLLLVLEAMFRMIFEVADGSSTALG